MKFFENINKPKMHLFTFLKWSVLGLLIGGIGGIIGAGFSHSLSFAASFRHDNPYIILLLPLGGLATIFLYRLAKMQKNGGTNEIIDAVLNKKAVKALIAPLIFITTFITQLFGGSAGREGAALQIGGSFASTLAKPLRLNETERKILVMSGMSAVFSALFGSPLAAALFTIEFVWVGTIFSSAFLPCALSAFAAWKVSSALGVEAESILLDKKFSFTAVSFPKLMLFACCIALLGIIVYYVFHASHHLAEKFIKNEYLRIVLGAVLIIGLTILVGDQRYNGAGMNMALLAIEGEAHWFDFLLKLLFTAITLSAGFKGGEIVPTFCIGATFGCVLGSMLGLDPSLAAALGLIGLFCALTNSPIASIVLSIEMFGANNLYTFATVCVITFMLAWNFGLYSSQRIKFSSTNLIGEDE